MTPELIRALEAAKAWEVTATPEEKAAMLEAQRQSWARAMAPCEHGVADFEECKVCFPGRGWR